MKQRASELGVHPDSTAKCAQIYAESVVYSGLAVRDGDTLAHEHISSIAEAAAPDEGDGTEANPNESGAGIGLEEQQKQQEQEEELEQAVQPRSNSRAAVQVTINVDSSLDTEKLEKQLELLKRFGAI